MKTIYLDNAATSPMDPRVIEVMTEAMRGTFGNPSSIHASGRDARHKLDSARMAAAKSIGAGFNEIIFTSGGTEADNLALSGTAHALKEKGRHIITSSIEHHAVLHTCAQLEKEGFEVTYLPVDEQGRVSVADVESALREDTILVSIMYGNNEVGTVQPISEIGELVRSRGSLLHTDAVQAFGMKKIDVMKENIDLLSISAHKINGPKGVGFLYVRKDVPLEAKTFGGEQERKRRAGTENLPSLVGMAEAIRLSQEEMDKKAEEYIGFKHILIDILKEDGIEFHLNGSLEHALPHVLNLSFPGTDVESMLVNLDLAGIAVSSGSACTAGSIEPSHVLLAMFGKDSERLRNSIRFSFGINNTEEDIIHAGREVSKIVNRLRK
ncbi:cysteine desulfurase [Rossellomorea vietnamensis]|uniref:cysteine desulfurase n=1 Tax=Rossellomorea vietnamensis TaxID=218284 RepID=A0A5D4MH42_9BACI|nr:cysteine desulfurase family protein [Rossellomorea vietnamensis]TYS00857.1 cysteine desulfurase [Rossellomorea vietnamensis]